MMCDGISDYIIFNLSHLYFQRSAFSFCDTSTSRFTNVHTRLRSISCCHQHKGTKNTILQLQYVQINVFLRKDMWSLF